MHNLHIPLPEDLYRQLKDATQRLHRPATQLAREAIAAWLAQEQQTALHEAIRAYAEAVAGTEADLDFSLEAAALEPLRREDPV
jgi:predicted DNA-binding protein